MTRLIDISVCLENDVASDPPVALPKPHYFDHFQTMERIRSFFPGLQADEMPALPPTGFRVCCFPVKVRAGSAGWTRTMAFVED